MSDQRLQAAAQLEQAADRAQDLKVFVGLDGFVDEIFHVVDKRESADRYTRLPTIARYADRLAQAAGKSTNVELVSQMVKLGGNGPIMANALASFGLQVTYVGNLGHPNLHPVFHDFARRATVHSIAEPGLTDALEFEDGKVMVGKHQSLREVNWENLATRFGIDALEQSLSAAGLVCFVNWTMLTSMSDIWSSLQRDLCPKLDGGRRVMFIDLADPEKRTAEDIAHALKLVGAFQEQFNVILGLNEKESSQIADVLGVDWTDASMTGLQERARRIRDRLRIDTVVIHPVRFAVAADNGAVAGADGPFTLKPKITTGAGDHFNAGFALGRLLGLSIEHSLWVGVATSGFYVRRAASPSIADVAGLLKDWPQPEPQPAS